MGLFSRLSKAKAAASPADQYPWAKSELFVGFDAAELAALASVLTQRTFEAGEALVAEGEPATHLLVLESGSAEVTKREPGGKREHRLETLAPGDVVGEIALFDELPRVATVRALEPVRAWQLPFQAIRPSGSAKSAPAKLAYSHLLSNLLRVLSSKVRAQAAEGVAKARESVAMGELLVQVMTLQSAYSILIASMPKFASYLPGSTTYVSLPIQLAFLVGSLWFIGRTGQPLHQFGLSFRHLVPSVLESLALTAPFLALLAAVKWVVLQTRDTWKALPLFEHTDVVARLSSPDVLKVLAIYAVTCLVQEIIVRSALQSTLERYLVGKRAKAIAIFVCALVFSTNHLHMSSLFAGLAFLPGVFWGVLYTRRPNVMGPTLSHVIVGGYVFFILGVSLPG
jgi:CRP/FNR family cyclic AMP-dependent transcriptional regulator